MPGWLARQQNGPETAPVSVRRYIYTCASSATVEDWAESHSTPEWHAYTRYDNGATSVDGLAPTPEGENKGACLGQGKSKKRSSLALASSEQLGLWPGKTKRCG